MFIFHPVAYLCLINRGLAEIVDRPDNYGKEFIFSFLTPLNEVSKPTTESIRFGSGLASELFVSTDVSAITSDGTRHQSTLSVSSQSITLSATAPSSPDVGIVLESTSDIFVYGLSDASKSTDGFLALPTDVLTGNYTIIAPDDAKFEAEIAVTGVFDDTIVKILSSSGVQVASFTLDRGELQEYTEDGEVSGYKIVADKKVAVMAGRKCLRIPTGFRACDHVVEMLPPTERLGQKFILAPLANNCKFGRTCSSLFKITAAYDDTTVIRHGTDTTETYQMNAGSWRDIRPDSSVISLLQSSKPILTAIFAASTTYTGVQGDPFFSLVPHIKAYASEYNAITCLGHFNSHLQYFNIEIETEDINGLSIGSSKAHQLSTFNCKTVPQSDYSACIYRVPCGTSGFPTPTFLQLRHDKPDVTFSLLAYGYAASISYGYIGGMRLPVSQLECKISTDDNPPDGLDNDCDGRVDEELRNFVDDDADGVVDEDLATSIPVITADTDINLEICTYSAPFSNPGNLGGYNTSGSHRCDDILNVTHYDEIVTIGVCTYDLIRTLRLTDGCGNIANDVVQNIHINETFNQTNGHDGYQFPASISFADWNLAIAYISQNNHPFVLSQSCPGRDEEYVSLHFTVQQLTGLYTNTWDYEFCDGSHSIGVQEIRIKNVGTIRISSLSGCINTAFPVNIPTVNLPTDDHRVNYFCLLNNSIELVGTLSSNQILTCKDVPVQTNAAVFQLTVGFRFGDTKVTVEDSVALVFEGCNVSCGENQMRGTCVGCKCLCNGNWSGDQCNHLRPTDPNREKCSGHGVVSCTCLPGYTGEYCDTMINYCDVTLSSFKNKNVTIGSICETHGTCVSTSMGAHCVCNNGFQGSFCDSTVLDEKFISTRCAVKNTTEIILPRCPPEQRCIPDNLDCITRLPDCLHTEGWCLPFNETQLLFNTNTPFSIADASSSAAFVNFDLDTLICNDQGEPVCTCDPGFTGEECDIIIDFCTENVTDLAVDEGVVKELCGPHGSCLTTVNGAFCECSAGWTGELCDQPIVDEISLLERCCLAPPLMEGGPCHKVKVGCPPKQRCVTDNLDCAFENCTDPIGWCIPITPLKHK